MIPGMKLASACAVVLVLVLAACAGANGENRDAVGSPSDSTDPASSSQAFESAAPSSSTLPPLTFDQPLPDDPGPDVGGAALTAAAFADGVVTFAEYERAMSAAVECMRTAGLAVDGPLRYPDGYLAISPGSDPRWRLTLRIEVPEDTSVDASAISGSCQAQWSYAVESLWFESLAPSQSEVQLWLESAWSCATRNGMELDNPPTETNAVDAVAAFGCKPWEALD